MKVGKEIGSAALIADGWHARVDGFTSLAVLLGAVGVWLGSPILDPLIGMLITIAILKIVLDSSKLIFTRLLDSIEPEVLDKVKDIDESVEGVCEVIYFRVCWIGPGSTQKSMLQLSLLFYAIPSFATLLFFAMFLSFCLCTMNSGCRFLYLPGNPVLKQFS